MWCFCRILRIFHHCYELKGKSKYTSINIYRRMPRVPRLGVCGDALSLAALLPLDIAYSLSVLHTSASSGIAKIFGTISQRMNGEYGLAVRGYGE